MVDDVSRTHRTKNMRKHIFYKSKLKMHGFLQVYYEKLYGSVIVCAIAKRTNARLLL